MNICLDLSPTVHRRAGIGRFTGELTQALLALAPENTYTALYNRAAEAQLAPPFDHLPRLALPWGDKPWRLRVALAHLFRRPQDAHFRDVDLFHATDHLLPFFARIPSIFTLYDLTYLTTDTHTTLNRLFLRLMMPHFLRQAAAVITISESTRRDMLRYYAVAPAKCYVTHGGVDARFRPASEAAIEAVRRQYGLPEQYILAVGTIEPRKNYTTLLAAYHALRDRHPGLRLVIVGKRGWRSEAFFQKLSELGLEDQVLLPGYVADADLPALYTAATVFAFASLYEGFGLPILEAMACGTPVVAGNTSALPEVVGEAGVLAPPQDVGALAAALAALLDNAALRADLCAKGVTQAQRFTWTQTAQATLQVYHQVFGA